MQKFLCKNHADRQIKFDGHSVPSGANYGQTAEGLHFIAVVRVNQIGMVWKDGRGLVPWQNEYNQKIVNFIKKNPVGANPELDHSKKSATQKNKTRHKYDNWYSNDCIKRRHIKVSKSRKPMGFDGAYLKATRELYGENIGRKQVNYLDGYR